MAEYDKGRLYWIKLTDRFISSDTVDFLMSQKDGANYVVLYQMLCLKTVNNGGVLARNLGEILVPYDVEKIQRDCKWFSIDTVRIALELYKRLGLIYENNDGILAITDFDRLIGSQSYGAEKKALQRQRKEVNLLEGGQQGGQRVDNCPPDKDIDKEKDKETTTTTINNTLSYLQSDEFKLFQRVSQSFKDCGILFHPDMVEDFIAYNNSRDWLGIGGESVLDNLDRYVSRWFEGEKSRRGKKDER
jgi:hypothetical protein